MSHTRKITVTIPQGSKVVVPDGQHGAVFDVDELRDVQRIRDAAPELLEALEELVAWSDEKIDRSESVEESLLIRARAAIAKARGGA